MATVMNPPIPYRGFLGGSCRAGTLIQINGFVPHHATGFAVNFSTTSGDKALHFNPRFNQNTIVMNTQTRGSWASEERVGLGSLQRGQYFELKILVENDKFMVALNGQHHCQFRHRLPKEHVNQVEVTGDVQVQTLSESNSYGPPAIVNPPVPFTTPISGGFTPGKKVVVIGLSTGSSFSINLQTSYEHFRNVGLHLNPRFTEHAIVLNDCTNGSWGSEQRSPVTVLPGQQFTFEIIGHPHAFEVRLNGVTVAHFNLRNPVLRPLHSLNVLHITGDVALQQILL